MKNLGILKINEAAEKIEGCLRFDKGSGKFPFPSEFLPFINKMKKEITGKYFHYPVSGGEIELKKEIVKIEKKNKRNLKEDDIVITHGGMSGLFSALSVIAKPGDEIITNKDCFEGFANLIESLALKQKRVDLTNPNELAKKINRKTKAIILNSPENPTGKVYSVKEISSILKISEKKKIYLLSDEVMHRVVYEDNKWQGPFLKKNVIIVNSFSKTWFIPGIRVGWVATKNQEINEQVASFINLQSVGVSLLAQLLMIALLKDVDYENFLKKKMKILSDRKKLLEKLLKENEIGYKHEVQGGMNFYIDLKENAEKKAYELLKKHKIALIPGSLFEGRVSNYARFGFGAVNSAEIKAGVKVLAEVLK